MEAATEEQQPEAEIDYFKFSVTSALSMSTKVLLSSSLNPPKCLPTDEGLPKDWRGIAHLIGLGHGDVPITEKDPMSRVMDLWHERSCETCNVGFLKQFLCQLDRWDIFDDTKEMIDDDIHRYIRLKHDSSTSASHTSPELEDQILTRHDANRLSNGLDAQHYDAFVLFADPDIAFATKLIAKLEDVFNLKLCTKNRDLVGGHVFEHTVFMKLISERCNRLVIIVTQSFLDCPLFHFFVRFTQALGIEQQRRKVVPLRLDHCKLPLELSYYHMLDYTRDDVFNNFWERLYNSVRTTTAPVISRRATSVSPAQNRPVIRTRPKSASFVAVDNEEKENKEQHTRVQFSEEEETIKNGDVIHEGDDTSQKSIKSRRVQNWFKKLIHKKDKSHKQKKLAVLN